MHLFRIIVGLFAIGIIGFLTVRSQSVSDFALESLNSGWLASYLFPRILMLLLTLVLTSSVLSLFKSSKILKTVIGVLIFGSCIGGYLILNLPYIDDWNRIGTAIADDDITSAQPIEAFLNKPDKAYEGLICLALPDCPHCINSIPKLEMMLTRTDDLNFSVLVFADDSTGVDKFLSHIGPTEIPVFLAPAPEATYALSRGRFPSFLYVKNGKVVYRWSNGQFGYPAMDWVENRLN